MRSPQRCSTLSARFLRWSELLYSRPRAGERISDGQVTLAFVRCTVEASKPVARPWCLLASHNYLTKGKISFLRGWRRWTAFSAADAGKLCRCLDTTLKLADARGPFLTLCWWQTVAEEIQGGNLQGALLASNPGPTAPTGACSTSQILAVDSSPACGHSSSTARQASKAAETGYAAEPIHGLLKHFVI